MFWIHLRKHQVVRKSLFYKRFIFRLGYLLSARSFDLRASSELREGIMNNVIKFIPALIAAIFITACGGSSGGNKTPPPPPPPTNQSPAGAWMGTAVTPDVADVASSFEFDDADGFTVGSSPFTADFQGGVAENRGMSELNNDGQYSWHVAAAAAGTVTFETAPSTLSLFTRVVTTGDVATVTVNDVNGDEITTVIVTDAFQEISVTRDRDAGDTLIGSISADVTTGEIVVDSFTFGMPSSAATNDVTCIVAPVGEFSCSITDTASGAIGASASGMASVSVDQVTGTGWLYAAPGEVFADGSALASLTISAGTVSETASLDLTVDGTGVPIAVSTTFSDTFDRGSSLATVAASYASFDIFGDASTFDVDAAGMISGTSAAGCTLLGQVSIIDAAVNAYDVMISVADGGTGTCGVQDGEYHGLGITQDAAATDDQFHVATFVDGGSSLVGDAVK